MGDSKLSSDTSQGDISPLKASVSPTTDLRKGRIGRFKTSSDTTQGDALSSNRKELEVGDGGVLGVPDGSLI